MCQSVNKVCQYLAFLGIICHPQPQRGVTGEVGTNTWWKNPIFNFVMHSVRAIFEVPLSTGLSVGSGPDSRQPHPCGTASLVALKHCRGFMAFLERYSKVWRASRHKFPSTGRIVRSRAMLCSRIDESTSVLTYSVKLQFCRTENRMVFARGCWEGEMRKCRPKGTDFQW